MAYVKIQGIKTETHLKQSLDYIKNPDKTDNGILISSFACSASNTAEEFEETLKRTRHSGNNIAHHICQSFSPEDNITPQQALEIGQEMMRRMYPNYQFLICTHVDREHIHNYIIMCVANFKDYKKLHSNPDNLNALRKVSDTLCEENGICVITQEEKNNREKLKKVIDEAIKNSNTFDEFLGYMQFQKYEIKQGKYLYFKGEKIEVFFNTKLLGTAYTEKNIKKRIVNHTELKKLEKCQKQADINNQNIQNINTQISEKKEIIKSRRTYWQYKPIIAELWKIKLPDEREKFKAENQFKIDRYNKVVEIMNRSKNPDGTAPETADLNIEIEKLETLKNNILIRQNKVKAELSSYENLKYNIERILDNNIAEKHKKQNIKREKSL